MGRLPPPSTAARKDARRQPTSAPAPRRSQSPHAAAGALSKPNMAGVDSTAALSALLASSAAPQAITVNQRALIDKILARYAAEWTVFRELLQNADDAGATECHLRFESQRYHQYKSRRANQGASSAQNAVDGSAQDGNQRAQTGPASTSTSASTASTSRSSSLAGPPTSATETDASALSAESGPPALDLSDSLHSWTFANDGMPFRAEDWGRLRRIAEGNPDPERIGAFGVGFYSVFSICENPMVASGGEVMGFFWDNDSLVTRRAPVPASRSGQANTTSKENQPLREDRWTTPAPPPEVSCAARPWTTFLLPLREPAPLPEHALTLARFLATSLTFTARVRRIALHWDDRVLCEFEKSIDGLPPTSPNSGQIVPASASSDLDIPSTLDPISPGRMLRLERLSSSRVQIKALHHPVLLAEAKDAELEARRKRAKAAEQAQRSGLSAGAAAVAGLFNIGSSSNSSGGESKRSAISNFFGLGKKSSPAPSAPPTAPATPPAPPPSQGPSLDVPKSSVAESQRQARPIPTDVHFRIATAHLNVVADAAFVKEIERSTKKPPPSKTAFSVVFADRDEVRQSRGDDGKAEGSKAAKSEASLDAATKVPATLTEYDERVLTNRHLFGTLLPWLSGSGLDEDATRRSNTSQGTKKGSLAADDAVARMAREQQGHVFIGFRTHQTTGFAGHLAARFIPTVERESLDFIDKYCRAWNEELLSMGGYLIRALYEREMTILGQLWDKEFKNSFGRPKANDAKAQAIAEDLHDRALHLLRFFTIRTSHPSGKVAEILQERFYAVSAEGRSDTNFKFRFMQSGPSEADKAIRIMSTSGVWPSSRVRLPNEILTPFIKQLPMLPAAHVTGAAEFIRSCTARGLLMEVQMSDVFTELEQRPLDIDEMKACLKWFILVATHPDYNPSLRAKLFESAVLTLSAPEAGKANADEGQDTTPRIQPLGEVTTYLNSQRIPTGLPLPTSCLEYEVSKAFKAEDLRNIFLWKELSISEWISHLVRRGADGNSPPADEENIQLSPAFSERVFSVLARAWGNISAAQQADVIQSLKAVTCIPTRNGMQKPEQAYFPSVSLFDDLSIVSFPSGSSIVKGNLENVLTALGVRKHVELQMIFTRLVAAGGWSHVELVTYLANNQNTLAAEEKDRLKKTAMFPREGEEVPTGADGKPKPKRYRANQLYEPMPALRALGLPVLDWTKTSTAQDGAQGSTAEDRTVTSRSWRPTSDEAKFLFQVLGLKRHPPIKVLLDKASDPGTTASSVEMRTKALAYLRDKWDAVYAAQYNYQEACQHAFIPCLPPKKNEKDTAKAVHLRAPHQAFTNVQAALLGFDVVDPSVFGPVDMARFKIQENPDPNELINRLVRAPTTDPDQARKIFEYLGTVNTFQAQHFAYLRDMNFIPVPRPGRAAPEKGDNELVLVSPTSVFFGGQKASTLSYKDVFIFIDFGEAASYFLRNCGVADEPTMEEVAQKLIRDPTRFYKFAGSSDSYLDILRQIATHWRRISRRTRDEMTRSPFLLGSKRESTKVGTQKGDIVNVMDQQDDEEQGVLTFHLLVPSQVVIADDANSHLIFGSDAFFAPHDELLEQSLYIPLGCPKLSSLVAETQSVAGTVVQDSPVAQRVKTQILERTPLFTFEQRKVQRNDVKQDTEWLKKRLDVLGVDGRGLLRTRTFSHGGSRKRHTQYTSALTTYTSGRLQLYVSVSQELDWFEVASALTQHLLHRQSLAEVLLYMTLLQAPLRDLKRRGFHVDRIIEQKEAEKKLADQRMREAQEAEEKARAAEEKRRLEMEQQVAVAAAARAEAGGGAAGPSGAQAGASSTSSQAEYEEAAKAAALAAANSGYGSSKGLFSKLSNRFKQGGHNDLSSLAAGTSSIANRPPPVNAPARTPGPDAAKGYENLTGSGPTVVKDMKSHSAGADPTPLDSIRQSVLSAIQASRPDGSERIQSQVERGQQIKEAEASYCDVGIAADLRKVGQVLGMNVYLSPEFVDPPRMLASNRAAMERLVTHVYRPVGEGIFGVAPGVLNLFCDVEGPTIAFNRGGTIFLNLRFYLAWHDAKVASGQPGEAIISVFHSMAHELAHNLATGHNSEHEYYTAAISEQHFLPLGALLQRIGAL